MKIDRTDFQQTFIEEYSNLEIYPMIGVLEREIGLLNDLAEALIAEGKTCKIENELVDGNYFDDSGQIVFVYESIDETPLTGDVTLTGDVILCKSEGQKHGYTNFKFHEKELYIKNNLIDIFNKHFWYYFDNGTFKYDNLICYCMIVKNGGELLEKVLVENEPFIDRWCILDTGSTDGSQEIIKRVLRNKKGKLYQEPFVNFKISRNRCLDLAGKSCKFTMMLDDTYALRNSVREFLDTVRGDQVADSFSLLIQSKDNEYYSNRIIKTSSNLRYIFTIHEVISDLNNVNVTIPKEKGYIMDYQNDYHEKRTNDRKQFDLELLFKELEENPDNPRTLYYIAQTYGCMGDNNEKAKYFELRINHPVQGYIQEKIDSYFELARTYNFKLGKEWDYIEKLYLQAYNLDKTRPDSLYFLGIHYFLEGNYQIAYDYFKHGFELGYPINSQYSLKPTLSFHFLPKFLSEVCYYLNDSVTGEKAASFFLQNNEKGCESWDLMVSWLQIHQNINLMGPVSHVPQKRPQPVFCIVADGGWGTWSGKDILTKGVGGSETWVIEMARHLSNDFDVVVFCRTDKSEMFENVGYNPIELFHNYIANHIVDYILISRYPQYIPVAIRGHALNVGLIFHDLLQPEIIIPKSPKLKWILGLSDFHTDLIKKTFPIFESKIQKINYGIDFNKFHETKKTKIKNSFIYSSFPNRGLVVLLELWNRIIELLPDATLHIYCDIDHEWVIRVAPDQIKIIRSLLNQPGIHYHGWVNKQTLTDAWKTSEYWLYPCIFQETFCLTAMEAAISKTFAITNDLAALSETVGDRGLVVRGSAFTDEWKDSVIRSLSNLTESFKNKCIESNYQWAMERSWNNQATKLKEILLKEKN